MHKLYIHTFIHIYIYILFKEKIEFTSIDKQLKVQSTCHWASITFLQGSSTDLQSQLMACEIDGRKY